jgi:hypothetical protein
MTLSLATVEIHHVLLLSNEYRGEFVFDFMPGINDLAQALHDDSQAALTEIYHECGDIFDHKPYSRKPSKRDRITRHAEALLLAQLLKNQSGDLFAHIQRSEREGTRTVVTIDLVTIYLTRYTLPLYSRSLVEELSRNS